MRNAGKDTAINIALMTTVLLGGSLVFAATSEVKLSDVIPMEQAFPVEDTPPVLAQADGPIEPTPTSPPTPTPTPTPVSTPPPVPGACPCAPPPTPTPSPTPSNPADWYPPAVTPTPDTSGATGPFAVNGYSFFF